MKRTIQSLLAVSAVLGATGDNLFEAVRTGDGATIKAWLKSGAGPNSRDETTQGGRYPTWSRDGTELFSSHAGTSWLPRSPLHANFWPAYQRRCFRCVSGLPESLGSTSTKTVLIPMQVESTGVESITFVLHSTGALEK